MNEIRPGQGHQQVGDRRFVTALRVQHLGIADPGRGVVGNPVMLGQLRRPLRPVDQKARPMEAQPRAHQTGHHHYRGDHHALEDPLGEDEGHGGYGEHDKHG